jgi:hypothetical protein
MLKLLGVVSFVHVHSRSGLNPHCQSSYKTISILSPFRSLRRSKVRPTQYTNLMERLPLVPYGAATFYNSNDFFGQSFRKGILPAAQACLLGGRIDDPLHGGPPPLSNEQRHWNLQAGPSTSCSSLRSNADEWSDAVYGHGEVCDWIEWKMGWRRVARYEGTVRAHIRRWRSSERAQHGRDDL